MLKKALFALSALAIFFLSCTPGLGYGVLLWSPDDEKIPHGALVIVYKMSHIDKQAVIGLPGKKDRITTDDFRVQLYGSKQKAETFIRDKYYRPAMFAQTTRQGHYIRKEPEVKENNWIYRLREGQIIKVIDQPGDKKTIGSQEGYWYKVLTEDGIVGYSFDTYLSVYDSREGGPVADSNTPEGDLAYIKFTRQKWYPQYFGKMIKSKQIDVDKFDLQFNFSIDTANKQIDIALPERKIKFKYDAVIRVTRGSYQFSSAAGEPPIDVIIFGDDSISVSYVFEEKAYADAFNTYEENVEEIAKKEREKADKTFGAIIAAGPVFSSTGYGKLTLTGYRTFNWEGYDKLKGPVIPGYVGNSGTVRNNILIGPDVNGEYDGVLSFKFQGLPEGKSIHFFYQLANNGLKLYSLPDRYIEENIAVKEDRNSTSFFLTPGK